MSEGKFRTGSLWRHVTVMSLTSSIGLMAMFAVDFVDMIFIAMLGNAALAAAVGYAGTLLFFTNSINIGLSIAAGTLVARAIGADRDRDAAEYATSVAMFGLLTGLALPVIVLWWLPELLGLLGAEGEALRLATRYVTIIVPTMSVLSVAMVGMAVLRANGDARRSMMATLVGGAVNAVLDPLFIFGFGLGLDGAAIASVIARCVIAFMALYPAIKVYKGFARPRAEMLVRDARAVSAVAVPAVLTSIATPVGSALVTREMARFGTDAVAGMAIIGRLTPVAFSVVLALSGAIGPIVGQNFGAGQFARVRAAFTVAVQFTAVYVVGVTLILFAVRQPLAGLFEAEGLTLSLLYLFCGPLALASFFNGVIFVANASFNNLGHPIYSTWVNWGRHTLGTWPLAVAGAALAGAPGVLIGQALGGLIFAAIAAGLALRVMNGLETPKSPDAFTEHRRFHLLFGRGQP
ncbi:MATE family efflux transporter [Roseisalinus antarcticus]|uniref:Multidrug export protein MepA n=1 Tax=Roseisalinus antarcticus TaxID=254357 RepID=A0A1Y5RQQ3_9RHOB|nr:MATE family efflux transporter [Roseisalinus antarcticus]SLN22774.1 Multidrug export protein MepA [Roseisalinus antarcticus]